MTSEPTPESDLEMLVSYCMRDDCDCELAHRPWLANNRAPAAARLSNLASERLSRITIPITEHYDWHRLRVNVAHLVEPKLVKWSE